MDRKWTERKYHVQDNATVEHKDVCIVTLINFLDYHLMVHIKNLMEQGVSVSILIYVFIQN